MRQMKLRLRTGKHGGWREGAGRKPLPKSRRRVSHGARAELSSRYPVHVTLKLVAGLESLRRKEVFRRLRDAVKVARGRGFGAAHFAILSNHIHLIMEPSGEPSGASLSRQIQSFSISFARKLNALMGRSGRVFADRYHIEALRTPTQVRHTLSYVLTNESRHRGASRAGAREGVSPVDCPGAGCGGEGNRWIRVEPFSSASVFGGWKALIPSARRLKTSGWWEREPRWEDWFDEIVVPPRGWLLKEGWMRGKGQAVKGAVR